MSTAYDIEHQAALFLIRAEEPDWSGTDQEALEGWLRESTAHQVAYWRLEHGWREADRIAALGPMDTGGERKLSLQPLWQMAVAASLAMVVGFGAMTPRPVAVEIVPQLRFATPVGGHKIVPLADGSVVELNTATLVKAAVSSTRREVWLDRGEAFFEVAHLDGRPFVVYAGGGAISVLGTRFSVKRDADKIVVSVLEGRVKVASASRRGEAPWGILTRGDIAVVQGDSTLLESSSEESVEAALAWRNGRLNFDDITLADAAAEFNRYNRLQIVIGDSSAARIRISGEFQASNAEAFSRLLRDAYRLHVRSSGEVLTVSS